VDVIDSEFGDLLKEVHSAGDMQAVLKSHRNFLANLARISFIDNITVQESFDRILQLCLRFLSACRLIQSETEAFNTKEVLPPPVLPSEEIDAIRRDFFAQLSYLFNIMASIDNKGFMFRLDFNGYLSQAIADLMTVKASSTNKG
jgi:hypothetical protein